MTRHAGAQAQGRRLAKPPHGGAQVAAPLGLGPVAARMAIGDALLARFKQAVALHLASLPAGTPAALAQVLDALALLSPHAEAVPLLESLLAWRLVAVRCVLLCFPGTCLLPAHPPHSLPLLSEVSAASDGGRKWLAEVDAAFWEAVSRLVASDDRPAPPPAHVSEALEALAFDVLLTLTSDSEAVERVARVLGHLSARRVPALTARLVAQLEARLKVDSSSARDQVAVLCRGLRHMRLSVRAFRGVARQPPSPR